MPRDGTAEPLPPRPIEPRQPNRDEIIAHIRQQNSGQLIERVINLEADKVVLTNELAAARRRIAELEQLVPVEPTDAGAESA